MTDESSSNGGARIDMRDGRLTRLIEYAQPIVTGCAVAALVYLANQFGSLRDAVIDSNKQMALLAQQNTRMVEDLRDHEQRLRAVEGRTLRGHGDDLTLLPSETRRGR